MKLYNFVKRDQLAESKICMPIIARYGTGGGNVPLILENNSMERGDLDIIEYAKGVPTEEERQELKENGYVPAVKNDEVEIWIK